MYVCMQGRSQEFKEGGCWIHKGCARLCTLVGRAGSARPVVTMYSSGYKSVSIFAMVCCSFEQIDFTVS